MKNLILLLIILLNFACSKKSDTPEVVKDYNSGLLTMVAGNKTFKTEKNYAAGTNPPIGYFQVDQTRDQFSNTFYFVTGNFDNLNSCNFYYSLTSNPNDIQKTIISPQNTYAIINGIKTNATKLVINVTKGYNYKGNYQMYDGANLLCQGDFSYQ
jgi:hypothetical protein